MRRRRRHTALAPNSKAMKITRSTTRPYSRPRWSPQTKWTVGVGLLIFAVYLLVRFSAVFTLLILSLITAYVLSPLVDWLERRWHIGRGWGAFIALVLLVLALIAFLAVLVPPLFIQASTLNLNLQLLLENTTKLINKPLAAFGFKMNPSTIGQQLPKAIQPTLEILLGKGFNVAMGVVTVIAGAGFMLVIAFYLMKDSAEINEYLLSLVPPSYRADYLRLKDEINAVWGAFFRGQITLALIDSAIITTGAFIIGLPAALPMGALAGLLEFLPSVGHGIWLTTAATLAFLFGSTWMKLPHWAFALLVIGLHIIFEQVDVNYMIPRVVGRRMRLHPLVVIIGIIGGAAFGGVLGIALAAPTIATLRVLGRYIYANLTDMDPFPGEVSEPLPEPDPRWWKRAPEELRQRLEMLRRRGSPLPRSQGRRSRKKQT